MDTRLKNEVKNLQKIGLSEDLALLSAGLKLGNEDVVNSVLNEMYDEQEELKEVLGRFKPFANLPLEDVPASPIKAENVESIFVVVDPITNKVAPFLVKQEEEIKCDDENIVIEVGSPPVYKWPVYRLPVGNT
jgi:hypothetical protein